MGLFTCTNVVEVAKDRQEFQRKSFSLLNTLENSLVSELLGLIVTEGEITRSIDYNQ